MTESLRVFCIPMFARTADAAWYNWLGQRLQARTKFPMESYTVVELQPGAEKATINDSVMALKAAIGTDKGRLARTAIIGHSLGAQVALRTLAELPEGSKIDALLCIAGWLKLDMRTKAIAPWLDTPFDEKRAASNANRILNVVSGSDANQINAIGVQEEWKERLGAETKIVATPGHFSDLESEDALDAALTFFGK